MNEIIEKYGTVAWASLMTQVRIGMCYSAIWLVLLAAIGIFGGRALWKWTEEESDLRPLFYLAEVCVLILFILVGSDFITALINPQYVAIKMVIK